MSPEVLAPQPKPHTPPSLVSVDGRAYPLRSARVRSRAAAGLAHTTLVQEFDNPHDEPLEVIYTMPLPADGAVLGYRVRMGERVIRGEIETREQAEADYKEALYAGKTAGLLEENRADTFQQRLGNLPGRTKAEIEIDVLHPLAFLAGAEDGPSWEFRFPTVVSTRYQGAPGRVADAASLDPDRAEAGDIPTRLTLDLQIADTAASAAQSPSHPLSVLLGADAVHVHLAEGAPLDRDLVLRWPAATPEVGVTVTEGPGLEGDDGRYALLTITPPAVPAATFHRDLTILLDASGSMEGEPIGTAKRIAGDLLRSLAPGDRFEVLAFSNTTVSLTRGIEDASEKAVESCLRKLEGLEAGGGTEMVGAIKAAMGRLRPDSQRQIVLVTDGFIGFESNVVEEIRSGRAEGVRIHAAGVGAAPNRTLTQLVSRAGRGVEVLVSDESEAATAASRLCAATALPVLTDLAIGGTAVRRFAPVKPRDVFAGQPVVLAVELRPEGGRLEVGGRLAGSKETWGWRTEIGAARADAVTEPSLPIGALYGRERIVDLETGVAEHYGRELDDAIEDTGLRHRIVSRRTSLVAIAETSSVDPRAPRRRERLAVEVPYGVSAEGVGLFAVGPLAMGLMETDARSLTRRRFAEPAGSLLRMFETSSRPIEKMVSETGMVQAVVVAWDERGVTLEIEVPANGFELPDGPVRVYLDGTPVGKVEVDEERSSAKGPHTKGVLVRLAFRWTAVGPAPAGTKVYVTWDAADRKGRPPRYAIETVMPARPPGGGTA